jgi:hypothetical protein
MKRYIGLDVHAASTTMAVVGASGKVLQTVVVETNGQALIETLKSIAGELHICLEEVRVPVERERADRSIVNSQIGAS